MGCVESKETEERESTTVSSPQEDPGSNAVDGKVSNSFRERGSPNPLVPKQQVEIPTGYSGGSYQGPSFSTSAPVLGQSPHTSADRTSHSRQQRFDDASHASSGNRSKADSLSRDTVKTVSDHPTAPPTQPTDVDGIFQTYTPLRSGTTNDSSTALAVLTVTTDLHVSTEDSSTPSATLSPGFLSESTSPSGTVPFQESDVPTTAPAGPVKSLHRATVLGSDESLESDPELQAQKKAEKKAKKRKQRKRIPLGVTTEGSQSVPLLETEEMGTSGVSGGSGGSGGNSASVTSGSVPPRGSVRAPLPGFRPQQASGNMEAYRPIGSSGLYSPRVGPARTGSLTSTRSNRYETLSSPSEQQLDESGRRRSGSSGFIGFSLSTYKTETVTESRECSQSMDSLAKPKKDVPSAEEVKSFLEAEAAKRELEAKAEREVIQKQQYVHDNRVTRGENKRRATLGSKMSVKSPIDSQCDDFTEMVLLEGGSSPTQRRYSGGADEGENPSTPCIRVVDPDVSEETGSPVECSTTLMGIASSTSSGSSAGELDSSHPRKVSGEDPLYGSPLSKDREKQHEEFSQPPQNDTETQTQDPKLPAWFVLPSFKVAYPVDGSD